MTSSRPLAPRPNPRPEAPRPESPLPRKVDDVGCRILTREFNFRLSVQKVAGTKMCFWKQRKNGCKSQNPKLVQFTFLCVNLLLCFFVLLSKLIRGQGLWTADLRTYFPLGMTNFLEWSEVSGSQEKTIFISFPFWSEYNHLLTVTAFWKPVWMPSDNCPERKV